MIGEAGLQTRLESAMTKSLVVTLSFTIGISFTAAAQTVRTPIAPVPVAAMQADAMKLRVGHWRSRPLPERGGAIETQSPA